MKTYPASHWQTLGDWVAKVRVQAGYSDTKRWAEAVGRSTRVLLGLERGEPVGPKTIEAVAEALGVANWSLFEILDKGSVDTDSGAESIERARRVYEAETGLEADDGVTTSSLHYVSDEDLLNELSRRLATRPLSRGERRMRELSETWDQPEPGADAAAHTATAEAGIDSAEVVTLHLGTGPDAREAEYIQATGRSIRRPEALVADALHHAEGDYVEAANLLESKVPDAPPEQVDAWHAALRTLVELVPEERVSELVGGAFATRLATHGLTEPLAARDVIDGPRGNKARHAQDQVEQGSQDRGGMDPA